MSYQLIHLLDLYHELRYFSLLSVCTEELLLTPNIITFLPNPLPSDNKNVWRVSNPIPYLEKKYLSASAISVNLNAQNKEFNSANFSSTRLSDHKFISWTI